MGRSVVVIFGRCKLFSSKEREDVLFSFSLIRASMYTRQQTIPSSEIKYCTPQWSRKRIDILYTGGKACLYTTRIAYVEKSILCHMQNGVLERTGQWKWLQKKSTIVLNDILQKCGRTCWHHSGGESDVSGVPFPLLSLLLLVPSPASI